MYIDSTSVTYDSSSATSAPSTRTWKVRTEQPSPEMLDRLNKSVLRSIPDAPAKWKDIIVNGLEEQYGFAIIYAKGGRWIKLKAIPKLKLEADIARAQGLPTSSNVDKKTDKSIAVDQAANDEKPQRPKKKTRGDITAFTLTAKRRFKESLCKIDKEKAPSNRWLFITLTLPVPVENAYKILEKTFAFMKKKMKIDLVAIWRKEWQDRGVEHFHLVMYIPGSGDLDDAFKLAFEETLVNNWSSRIQYQCGTPVSPAACNVQLLEEEDAIDALSVYGEKDDQDVTQHAVQQGAEPLPGRRWGIFNVKGYKALCTIKAVVIQPTVYWIFRRNMRTEINKILRSHPGKKTRFRPSPFKIDEQYMFKSSDAVPALLERAEGKARSKWISAGKQPVLLMPSTHYRAPGEPVGPSCSTLISMHHITPPPQQPTAIILPHIYEITVYGTH